MVFKKIGNALKKALGSVKSGAVKVKSFFGNIWERISPKKLNFTLPFKKENNNDKTKTDDKKNLINDLNKTNKTDKDLNLVDPKDLKPKQNNSKINDPSKSEDEDNKDNSSNSDSTANDQVDETKGKDNDEKDDGKDDGKKNSGDGDSKN